MQHTVEPVLIHHSDYPFSADSTPAYFISTGVYFDMSPSDITSETLHRATLRLFILPGPSDETVVQLVEVLISGARDAAPGPAAQFTGPDQVQYPEHPE